jgi:hypothetical protein
LAIERCTKIFTIVSMKVRSTVASARLCGGG